LRLCRQRRRCERRRCEGRRFEMRRCRFQRSRGGVRGRPWRWGRIVGDGLGGCHGIKGTKNSCSAVA
jgi:hypothetical protein